MFKSVLAHYGIDAAECEIAPFGTGLINNTWKVSLNNDAYILQRINQNVFKIPQYIADNIRMIGDYLKTHSPGYRFVMPLSTEDGKDLVQEGSGFFRLMPFIRDSRTYIVASDTSIAREAAKRFGEFTSRLAGFDATKLKITLPDFHNLTLRYHQFEQSLATGNSERIAHCAEEIEFIKKHRDIVSTYQKIEQDRSFRKRVTHHDTKISNILFDENNNGICVIDLDTTMAGYYISDVGDMMRTYLCPIGEEENNFENIQVREDYFIAIAGGYLQEMIDELSENELNHFVYSGEFIIYMQAVRFLADYFNNDVYYGSRYPEHNLMRARNQMVLLQRYLAKAPLFKKEVLQLAGSLTR